MEVVIIVFSMPILKLEWEWYKILPAINLLFYSSLWRQWNNPTSSHLWARTACLHYFPLKYCCYWTSQEKVTWGRKTHSACLVRNKLCLMLHISGGHHLHEAVLYMYLFKGGRFGNLIRVNCSSHAWAQLGKGWRPHHCHTENNHTGIAIG